MGGLAGATPAWAAIFGFFVFASAGLPGLSGFVGEFLVLLGAFAFNPATAAVAALVMVLAAGYLLWMFQRVVTGELSDFLKGLGDHLTDITRLEILTLVPLGVLIVLFGLLPGLILERVEGSVESVLGDVRGATAIAIDPALVAVAFGLLAFVIVARAATLPRLRRPAAASVEGVA
jgi:NADH-quinone oxidoreductase subunit M